MHKLKITVSIACLISAMLPKVCLAWGTEGHQVIALIAQSQLTPKARAEVERLLALEQTS